MKVLQLCNKPPIPTVDGGCIAMHTISQGLIDEKIGLKILTASTHKHPFQEELIPAEFLKQSRIEGVFLDTRVNIIDAFSALVTADSYNVNRFFSTDFDRRLMQILEEEQFDIVHLESLFMTPYIATIRKMSGAKIILRSHNLEHIIWERLANSEANKPKRMYLKHLASRLKKYELQTINEVDGIAAISQEDTKRFTDLKCEVPMITIPFGINLDQYHPQEKQPKRPLRFFHIGAMNWEPNKEGINWFIDSIWPKVQQQPLTFHMAGRFMPNYLSDLHSDQFLVYGEVDSVQDFMNQNDVMIVPLLSGSGIRIKIIEAMAMGKAVISTSVGAEGINYTDRKDIIIANSEEEIAAAMIELSQHPEKIPAIGENARKLIQDQYDNKKIIKNLIKFYQS